MEIDLYLSLKVLPLKEVSKLSSPTVVTETFGLFLISEQNRLQKEPNNWLYKHIFHSNRTSMVIGDSQYIHKHHYILGTYWEHSNVINFGDCFYKSLGIDIDTNVFPYFERI